MKGLIEFMFYIVILAIIAQVLHLQFSLLVSLVTLAKVCGRD
jgi:hypothetical protein